MPRLLRFRLTDGLIDWIWEANNREILEAQIVEGDTVHGYLHADTDMRGQMILETQYIHFGGLTDKAVLVLAGTPTPFNADGVAVCTVTVTPFVPCTLLANGVPTVLTTGEEELLLTSDVPQVFTMTLQPIGPYRADPIMVEAT